MDETSGKISFGFSKISKKQVLSTPKPTFIKKIDQIQYIDSLENNSFNLINEEKPKEKQELVIPLQNPNLLTESMIEAVRSRTEKVSGEIETLKKEVSNDTQNLKKETLDEMAAREIIEDINKVNSETKDPVVFTVPLPQIAKGGEESNLDDYNNVPISDFGLAMLRGMGWKPEKGIGKNEKVVKVEQPALRPKGMGLGADKAIKTQKLVSVNNTEDTVLKKQSKVRITYGRCKNMYGIVQAFDDDSSRISVKLSVGNETLEINQCFIQLVSTDEFNKYSKVLNINTYSKFQENELKKEICQSNNDKKEAAKNTLSSANRNSNIKDLDNRKYKKNSSDSESEQERKIKNHFKNQKSIIIQDSNSESDSRSDRYYKRTSKDTYKSKERYKRYSDSESYDSDVVEDRYKNKKKDDEYKLKDRYRKFSHSDDSENGKKYHKSSKNVSKSREDHKKYSRYSTSSDDSNEDYKKISKSDKKEKDRKHKKSSKSDSNKHKKSKKKKKRSRSRSAQRSRERRK